MPTTLIRNPTLDQTVAAMRTEANKAKKTLRPLAEQICHELEPGDYNSEIGAIYAWVCKNIRYTRDIHNVEYVQSPARLIQSMSGDCDDIACLLAALCMALGNEARFLVVGFENRQPSHVFMQVAVRTKQSGGGNTSGEKLWVTLDPVADASALGPGGTVQMHGRIRYCRIYPVGDGGGLGSFGNTLDTGGPSPGSSQGVQTFSVFDPYSRSFTYYECAGNSATFKSRGTFYRALTKRPSGNKEVGLIGFTPEALALPLPGGCRAVGQGTEAKGIIAWIPSEPHLVAPVLGRGVDGVDGLGGLGDATLTTPSGETLKVETNVGAMVAAASIAAVVGAIVTSALKKKKR